MDVIILRTFKQYTLKEAKNFIKKYDFKRKITQIHFHHTWRPTKRGYIEAKDKERVIWSMWKYHTDVRGWSDIGQHFTIAPDGTIWDGRALDMIPASIKGHNTGAIAIEHIGNFDKEYLEDEQLEASIKFISAIINRIKEIQEHRPKVVFHREYSAKSCPGMNVNKEIILKKINDEIYGENLPFKDISTDSYSFEIINKAKELGLIKGAGDGYFYPHRPLTREQGVILIMRLYNLLKE